MDKFDDIKEKIYVGGAILAILIGIGIVGACILAYPKYFLFLGIVLAFCYILGFIFDRLEKL